MIDNRSHHPTQRRRNVARQRDCLELQQNASVLLLISREAADTPDEAAPGIGRQQMLTRMSISLDLADLHSVHQTVSPAGIYSYIASLVMALHCGIHKQNMPLPDHLKLLFGLGARERSG